MNTNVEKREYVDEVLIPRIRKFSLMRLSSFRILVFDIFLFQHFPLLSFPIHPSKCLPFDIFPVRYYYLSVFLFFGIFALIIFPFWCFQLILFDIITL